MHFARPYDLSKGTVGFRLRAVKPTMFLGVPRVWEKIQAKITKIGQLVGSWGGECSGRGLCAVEGGCCSVVFV